MTPAIIAIAVSAHIGCSRHGCPGVEEQGAVAPRQEILHGHAHVLGGRVVDRSFECFRIIGMEAAFAAGHLEEQGGRIGRHEVDWAALGDELQGVLGHLPIGGPFAAAHID